MALSSIIQLPFLVGVPVGYGSGLTVAIPFSVKFDDLNMTSPDNRFGYFDSLGLGSLAQAIATRMGWPTVDVTAVNAYLGGRKKRDVDVQTLSQHPFGDRQAAYEAVEGLSSYLNFATKDCLLRLICEFHMAPVADYGLFGEFMDAMLSPSSAPYANIRMSEYVNAEMTGKLHRNCSTYEDTCPQTFFKSSATREESSHRQKRFIMFGPGRQILFPPATVALFTPAFNLPFFRDLPKGLSSQLSYSFPFTFNFDVLGLTSSLNTFGRFFFGNRRRREIGNRYPDVNYAGGDRTIMYAAVENAIHGIGLDGRACLLRTICEMNEEPVQKYGLVGELLHIFLTPSRSPYANSRLGEYVAAELLGRSCGDCSDYFAKCKTSIFTSPSTNRRFRSDDDLEECKELHKFRPSRGDDERIKDSTRFEERIFVQRRNISNKEYFAINAVSDLTMPKLVRIKG